MTSDLPRCLLSGRYREVRGPWASRTHRAPVTSTRPSL